jgi:glycosyltransferase involved in cell wall biosynthesis
VPQERTEARRHIGLWSELRAGSRWTNEGVSRVIGFIVEGAAQGNEYTFHLVVDRALAAEVRSDLRGLDAVEGRDWVLWSPEEDEEKRLRTAIGRNPDLSEHELAVSVLAEFANRNVPVEGWVITFPHFTGALRLEKSKATLYPDACPFDFPLGWPDDASWGRSGYWPTWRAAAETVMAASNAVITFSEHVAQRHAASLCGVPPDKIRVIPLAPPDLAPLLDFLDMPEQTPVSRAKAGEILREHARTSGMEYLRDFPFEEVDFIASSTQDRPTKNLAVTAEVVRHLVRDRRRSMKLFLTAHLQETADWTRLPALVEQEQVHLDVLSLPDLPRRVHAALLHCATLVVHSSFFEGIVGALPFYEAASVGTPALLARGPHTDELLKHFPALGEFTFDPYDPAALASLIEVTVSNRQAVVERQRAANRRLRHRTWADVASAYAMAALTPVGPVQPLASA